jgi:hypothetical protein
LTSSGLNDFETWVRSKWAARPFYIGSHKFEKTESGQIKVDKGSFELEEAFEIGRMLLSINPVARLSAQIAIWEKNGTLVKGVLVIAILLLVIVIIFIRR